MKKLVVSLTLATATFVSSSAAFADEINTDHVTTDKSAQPAQTPATSTSTTATAPPATTTTTSQTTTTSAPLTVATPTDRPSYTLQESRRPHRPLLITGTLIFAGTYATTAALTAANDGPDRALYIPVVGPWLHLADREGTEGRTEQTLLIGASGVAQGAGVALMLTSLFVSEKKPVGTISAGPVKMMVGPGGAVGTF